MYRLENQTDPVPEAIAPADLVPEGVLCARCGYDLRGLPMDSRCPECAGPIRHSLRAQLLEYAAPEYVRKLHVGAILAEIAAISAIASMGAMVLTILVAISFAATGADIAVFFVVMGIVGALGPLVSGGAAVTGWWLLTTRDPGVGGARRDTIVRRVLRVSVAVAGVSWLGMAVPPLAHALMDLPPAVYIPLMTIIGIAMLVSTVVTIFATAPFLDTLGKRLEDDRIPRWTATQTKLAIAAAAAVGLTILTTAAGVPLGCLWIATLALPVVLLGYHAALMDWTRRLLKACWLGEPLPRTKLYGPRASDPFNHRP